jgi:hypothetical protein
MPVITSSTETIPANTPGAWWSPTLPTIACDVDNAASVTIETRRGPTGDASPKPVFWNFEGNSVLKGPCSHILQVVPGRQYRYVAGSMAAQVASQE